MLQEVFTIRDWLSPSLAINERCFRSWMAGRIAELLVLRVRHFVLVDVVGRERHLTGRQLILAWIVASHHEFACRNQFHLAFIIYLCRQEHRFDRTLFALVAAHRP